jgi:type II secretory pathway component PulJ
MPRERIPGYTLIEIVVALFLFTIGGLALVTTSALVGREMSTNAARERAARMAASRLEIVGAGCRRATSGRETFQQVESEWSVTLLDSARLRVLETVNYPSLEGRRSEQFLAVLPCPP